MSDSNIDSKGQISVSKKTLLHISEGIYRTEGSAIKELINNSFDAKATKVIINTNYPLFDILSCQDNGEGMSKDEFLRIVTGGIGDSPKAKISVSTRPTIGRLGIGILAIAQICRSFTIISHHEKTKTAFRGRMIFRTDVDEVAKMESKENYEIGTWILEEEMDYEEANRGVLVFTQDLRQSFIKRFKESEVIKKNEKNNSSLEFKHLLSQFYENNFKMVKELGPYFELIWELCNLLPVTYYNGTPIRNNFLKSIQKHNFSSSTLVNKDGIDFIAKKQSELLSYDFNVVFDDIKLFRPIQLPYPIHNRNNELQESQIFYLEYDKIVRKRRLKFYGYIIAQEMAIKPRDLKGIQIRIKNVGIGSHDPTLLKYDKIESPRDNWISGEIYVEEGLESALNIDRDSFNENDEHYYILRSQLHSFLGELVFPTISSNQRKRNKIKQEGNFDKKKLQIMADLKSLFTSRFKGTAISFDDVDEIQFNKRQKKIILPSVLLSKNSKARMEVFSRILMDVLDNLREAKTGKEDIESFINKFSTIVLW